jgi:uncharacterized membrane protein
MRWFALLVAGLALLAGVAAAVSGGGMQAQARWVITDLGTLADSQATAINNRGQIVGTISKDELLTWPDGTRSFLWTKGKVHRLAALRGLKYSEARDINDHGQIVGWSFSADENRRLSVPFRAILWANGRVGALGSRGRESEAQAINEKGQVVGYLAALKKPLFPPEGPKTLPSAGVMWESGLMHDLHAGSDSTAEAINERGQIVGTSHNGERGWFRRSAGSNTTCDLGRIDWVHAINDYGWVVGGRNGHATVWENCKPRDLATVAREESMAWDINNRGQIVGSWQRSRSSEVFRAALWENRKLTLLPNLPGGTSNEALSINEEGQIVGSAETRSGDFHAVLWTLKR